MDNSKIYLQMGFYESKSHYRYLVTQYLTWELEEKRLNKADRPLNANIKVAVFKT